MAKQVDNGGPAFPLEGTYMVDGKEVYRPGMSLRDWFAGMALAEVPDPTSMADVGRTADLCYGIADAMLERRKR